MLEWTQSIVGICNNFNNGRQNGKRYLKQMKNAVERYQIHNKTLNQSFDVPAKDVKDDKMKTTNRSTNRKVTMHSFWISKSTHRHRKCKQRHKTVLLNEQNKREMLKRPKEGHSLSS